MADQVPSVARIVHYRSFGTPDGEFEAACRAAIVTDVVGDGTLWLAVMNPTGLFFDGNVPQDESNTEGGSWHWPERVDA